MIADDFIINFDRKVISYNPQGSDKVYGVVEFYSYVQDLLDNPANMKYEVPLVAKSKTKFKLINSWKINKRALKHLEGGTIS